MSRLFITTWLQGSLCGPIGDSLGCPWSDCKHKPEISGVLCLISTFFIIGRLQAILQDVGFYISTLELLDCIGGSREGELKLLIPHPLTFSSLCSETPPDLRLTPTLLTEQLTFQTSCATLTAFNHWEKTGNVLILFSYTPTPPSLCPSATDSHLSCCLRCVCSLYREQRCACVGEPGERCTVLRTGSVGQNRITALDNRVVVEGETGPGPGAGEGPGGAPWLLTARSPKPCPNFFYSPF